MPEPTNPYAPSPEWNPGADTYTQADAVVWSECDFAWREWLASDEAVERVAETDYAFNEGFRSPSQREQAASIWAEEESSIRREYRDNARAVLAALRGDET